MTALYAAPTGAWSNYPGGLIVPAGKSLHTRATKSGLTTSAVVRHDYWYDPYSKV
jgi:hypothetical protein